MKRRKIKRTHKPTPEPKPQLKPQVVQLLTTDLNRAGSLLRVTLQMQDSFLAFDNELMVKLFACALGDPAYLKFDDHHSLS